MDLIRFFPKADCLVLDGETDGDEFKDADISIYSTCIIIETDCVDIYPISSIAKMIICPFELRAT